MDEPEVKAPEEKPAPPKEKSSKGYKSVDWSRGGKVFQCDKCGFASHREREVIQHVRRCKA